MIDTKEPLGGGTLSQDDIKKILEKNGELFGDCYSIGVTGARIPCPHKRGAGIAHCCHYQAAERAEKAMFGGNAADYFADLQLKEVA